MVKLSLLCLPDGRHVPYRIRSSARVRNLCLKITMAGLTVSAPRWLRHADIEAMVAGKSSWVAERLEQLGQAGHLAGLGSTARPHFFTLPALAETWHVEYLPEPGRLARARTVSPDRILLHGPTDDDSFCNNALQRWLACRAKEAFAPWLEGLAAETGLRYSRLTVRNQQSRWGSCSSTGAISLNCKLLFLPPALVRYVLLHELCHTREHNHTARYWALLRQHEPAMATRHQQMREAWTQIPAWAHPQRRWTAVPALRVRHEAS